MQELRVRVFTGKKKESVVVGRDGRLHVAVSALPRDGEANERVRELLAEHLRLPLAHIRLVRGKDRTSKTFIIN